MSDLYKPCYKYDTFVPCYKVSDHRPIYKVKPGDWTEISFAWGSDGRDLDICAYWIGTDTYFGYGYNTGTTEYIYPNPATGPYHVIYSGDKQGSDDSEFCKVKKTPWNELSGRSVFVVHFNFYGHDEQHPANTCTVIASQVGGKTFVKPNQSCGTNAGQKATLSSPACMVVFDEIGNLIGIE